MVGARRSTAILSRGVLSLHPFPEEPMKRAVVLLAALALAAAPAAAQIPERFENLQVLPKDIPRDSLLQIMRAFSFSLGVRCQHCHVGEEGRMDFDSDDKEAKRTARFMMRMTRDLNANVLAQLADRSDPPVPVRCVTCHRGSPLPRTIDLVLEQAIDTGGVEAAVRRYRELRERTMESGRYDFGETPVNELARRLAATGKTAEALALLRMNAEFHPNSGAIDLQMGDVHRARGEREQAIVRYRMALEKDPNNRQARRRLEELGAAPPPQP
jgi:photosynthetic reaction center cytochrome c subunit